jgi:hypothetical protein
MLALENCRNIADLRLRAKSRLPSPMFHYIDGGADDEWSMQRNTQAFDDYTIMPRQLRDVGNIDLQTNVLGAALDLPFLSPQPACPACFTRTRNWACVEPPIILAPCIAFRPWPRRRWPARRGTGTAVTEG